jgi:Heterokaryon incompatibility protein (HET)
MDSTAWLPTRLINVGTDLDDKDPFLYITSQASVKYQPPTTRGNITYLTLSHCWGTSRPARLLLDNHDSMLASIPLRSLPKTFIDAIHITRRLGFTYLWIDSLCIIQDSKEDWHREAVRMEEVYRNSECTIAASGAQDGNGGCFVSRDPSLYQPIPVEVNYPKDTMLLEKEKFIIAYGGQHLRQQTSLFSRAWVVQEQILSRRSLYFGEFQIFWECYSHSASEASPDGLNEAYEDTNLALIRTVICKEEAGTEFRQQAGLKIWGALVRAYSMCGLTNPQDKLVALSGIAVAVKHEFGGYMCGMWKGFLPHELLWEVAMFQRKGFQPFRPRKRRAPSWSWASIEGIIEYDICTSCLPTEDATIECLISVLDIVVQTEDLRGVGSVTNGFLRVDGRPAVITWDVDGTSDISGRKTHIVAIKDEKGVEYPARYYDLGWIRFDSIDDLKASSGRVLCLPIVSKFLHRGTSENLGELHWLLLRENGRGELERVGISTSPYKREMIQFIKELRTREMVLV